ncbi:MAG: amidase [Deinococcales bacterium]
MSEPSRQDVEVFGPLERLKHYLNRIETLDRNGPKYNAVIELNPDALSIAKSLESSPAKGPLHGLMILIKDNIDTADKMLTTAGSLALCEDKPSQDAFVVKRLREAGAVILGKTNLSEWANFRSTRSSSGWSSRGGQTLNAHDVSRSPCGSSSGSGVAVAAHLCSAAIGTETDGSIVCPASVNGIVGIKPTLGLISRSGIIPIAHSQDTAGPMARTVAEAATLLGPLTGVDPEDEATFKSEGRALQDYCPYLDSQALEGARIGLLKNIFVPHEGVDACYAQAAKRLRAAGAQVIELEIHPAQDLRDAERKVLCYEFKADLASYLARRGGVFKSLAELIAFNEANKDKVMPYFQQEIFLAAEATQGLADEEYLNALRFSKNHTQNLIDGALKEHKLAALVAPTGGPAWTIDKVNGDRYLGSSSSLAAISGYPSITVPMGKVHGLPVGLSWIASAFEEAKLIALTYAFERMAF